ncbi:MAG: zinc metallopeptidase [Eubacteriales bacterium]|nr:zinc metallopeptidase [Eubacteriales bacterium]
MPFGFYFDPTMLILIPAIILASFAQMKVSSAYAKYSNIPNQKGMTGAQVAKELLERQGIYNVSIEMVEGRLSDHYDPRSNVVRLSRGNYSSSSIAALSVAAHEVGHAIQHSKGYAPLSFRTALVPIVNISSSLSWPLIFIGLLFGFSGNSILLKIGILLFCFVVLFQLVTLPVEFNASKRANEMLEDYGFLSSNEISGSKNVLSAAALTYVAAAATSILQLVRLLIILNNRQRD